MPTLTSTRQSSNYSRSPPGRTSDSKPSKSSGTTTLTNTAANGYRGGRTRRLTTLHFLFNFQDIGITGIRKWIRLRDKHTRAIRPFVRLRNLRTANIESQLLQSSIALEALGYDLAPPADFDKHGRLKFRQSLERVHDSLGFDAVHDPDEWINTTTPVYRGVKHPDNPQPDVLDMVNALRDNIVILRSWVALQLGTKPSQLPERLRRDRQASATYEKATW